MIFEVFLVAIVAFNVKGTIATPEPQTRCNNRMAQELPITFPEAVAHGIHTLTMSDIQFYFPTDNIATLKEDFQLPVTNPDLNSATLVLSQPLDFKHTFTSPALRAVDQVLSNMNSPNSDLANFNDLEKIVHAAHMQDIWSRAGEEFKKLQESNDLDSELCVCIRDVERNGILRSMERKSIKLRDPELFYGAHSSASSAKRGNRPNVFHHHPKRGPKVNSPEVMSGRMKDPEEEPLPHLASVNDWNIWKEEALSMKSYEEEDNKQIALFMYCALQ